MIARKGRKLLSRGVSSTSLWLFLHKHILTRRYQYVFFHNPDKMNGSCGEKETISSPVSLIYDPKCDLQRRPKQTQNGFQTGRAHLLLMRLVPDKHNAWRMGTSAAGEVLGSLALIHLKMLKVNTFSREVGGAEKGLLAERPPFRATGT